MSNAIKFVLSILICHAVGAGAALFTATSASSWYDRLAKPSFNPPDWLFGPVWLVLYTMMGIALFLVWTKRPAVAWPAAVSLFAVQLILNFFWSLLFFRLQAPLLAFIEILVLWAAILGTILVFAGLSKTAAILLIPYWLWVSFAALLNFFIWRLNH